MKMKDLKAIGTELMDAGMIIKISYSKDHDMGIHAHYPLDHDNDKAITVFYDGNMELQARYGRENFATVRYSREEMVEWLGIAD